MAQDELVDRGDVVTPPTVDEVVIKADDKVIDLDKKDVKEVVDELKTPEKAEKEDKDDKTVPLARLKEAVDRERAKLEAATAKNRELEGKLATQTTSKDIESAQKTIKELIKQRNSHLSDGTVDEASKIDEQIIELQEAIADRKAELKVSSARADTVESVKFDAVVERLEAAHPEINPDHDDYDEEVAVEIRALMRGYQSELKLAPSAALARAAKRVFGDTKAKEEPEKKEDKAVEEGLRRKTEATERNLEAAKKQPASAKDVGLDHDKKGGGLDAKTIMNLPYSEFIKIGEDVLSKARGDTL